MKKKKDADQEAAELLGLHDLENVSQWRATASAWLHTLGMAEPPWEDPKECIAWMLAKADLFENAYSQVVNALRRMAETIPLISKVEQRLASKN